MLLSDRNATDDAALLRHASQLHPELDYHALDRETLGELARRHGCDLATCLLYDRVKRNPSLAPFIDDIDAKRREAGSSPQMRGRLLIAPAAFFRELPSFGGRGDVVAEVAKTFGLQTALLPSKSTGSVTENARLIRDALVAETDQPTVVVSLSKGGTDVRLALESCGTELPNLRAWVQIGGIIRGSPVVDGILSSRVRRTVLRAYLACLRADLSVCRELTWTKNDLLDRPLAIPPSIEVVNVVGFPLARHLRGNTRRRYFEMRHLGPNDGSTLLVDSIVEPGHVYPLWSADHYFRVPEVPELLRALFRYLAERWPR